MAQDGGGELVTALRSGDKYAYKDKFANTKWAIAGAAIAADLITTAGLGPVMQFRDPDRMALTQGSHKWVAGMEWDLMRSSW